MLRVSSAIALRRGCATASTQHSLILPAASTSASTYTASASTVASLSSWPRADSSATNSSATQYGQYGHGYITHACSGRKRCKSSSAAAVEDGEESLSSSPSLADSSRSSSQRAPSAGGKEDRTGANNTSNGTGREQPPVFRDGFARGSNAGGNSNNSSRRQHGYNNDSRNDNRGGHNSNNNNKNSHGNHDNRNRRHGGHGGRGGGGHGRGDRRNNNSNSSDYNNNRNNKSSNSSNNNNNNNNNNSDRYDRYDNRNRSNTSGNEQDSWRGGDRRNSNKNNNSGRQDNSGGNNNRNRNRNHTNQDRVQAEGGTTGGGGAGGALRSRLDQFRASSRSSVASGYPMARKQPQGQQPRNNGGASAGGSAEGGSWRRTRGVGATTSSGSRDSGAAFAAAAPKLSSASPLTSSDDASTSTAFLSEGRSTVSALRETFMGVIKKSREAKNKRRAEEEDKAKEANRNSSRQQRYGQQQYGQQGNNSSRSMPSWRDRQQLRQERNDRNAGWQEQHQQQQATESASDKILREMEEAKKEAIRVVASSGMVTTSPMDDTMNENDQDDDSNTVVLPHRSLTLSELSSLLRVRVSKLRDTVSSLGERVPQDDSDAAEYRIDIDVAELASLELGFDPVRAKHGAGHKWKTLEEAERRMRRGVGADSSTAAAAAVDAGEEAEIKTAEDMEYESLPPRPPVVCIMGHVDHGKTTLMDALRRRAEASGSAGGKKKKGKGGKKKQKAKNKSSTNTKKSNGGAIVGDVAGTEAGGITQIITAFQVSLPSTEDSSDSDMDAAVTFLDTPGHAAFKSMRLSGSSGADIIVLVVAADDGVSPQTIEIIDTYKSIARAQPGSISLVVAMTKIDKPGVDIDESRTKIENQLLEQGITTEGLASSDEDSEFGPPAQLVPVSGMTGEGLDDLIEGLVLQSEVMDLRADEEARAEGVVMDARVDKGLGVVADCVVRWGKLERGDFVVSGVHGGKIRILSDVDGGPLKKARPSQPVRIVGFKTVPKAGDPIVSVQSEEIAKELISRREALASAEGIGASSAFRADSTSGPELQVTGMASKQGAMLQRVLQRYGMDGEDSDENETIRIPVIIKADADGSLEAVRDAMLAIKDETKRDIVIDPVSMGVGPPTTTDVTMAKESGASVFCFGVKGAGDKAASSLAESEGVSIVSNDVIYSLLDEAKDLFASHLPAVAVEKVHGSGEVKAVYDINNKKDAERVAGMQVADGQLFLDKTTSDEGATLACHYRILRNGEVVSGDSEMLRAKSLRRYKEEVSEVRRGDECGLVLGVEDLQEGDVIECYSIEMKSVFV